MELRALPPFSNSAEGYNVGVLNLNLLNPPVWDVINVVQPVLVMLASPVRNGHRYRSNRLDCLDYPLALKLGLPIGSGMMESGHRHVLQARLKKAGAAWWPDHADQIAHLRVLRANNQWSSFWN